MNEFLTAAQPYALELFGLALTPAILWVSVRVAKKTGLDIQAKHREALHSALMTAARLALAKQLTAVAAVELIMGYVRQSVPDALGKLKPSEDVLKSLATSKLEQAAVEAGKAIGTAIKAGR